MSALKDTLFPSDLLHLGAGRVRLFKPIDGAHMGHDDLQKLVEEAAAYAAANGGEVYTGIHPENGPWDITRWWDKGWHLSNITHEYIVILPSKSDRKAIVTVTPPLSTLSPDTQEAIKELARKAIDKMSDEEKTEEAIEYLTNPSDEPHPFDDQGKE
jgi:hypothetical protein